MKADRGEGEAEPQPHWGCPHEVPVRKGTTAMTRAFPEPCWLFATEGNSCSELALNLQQVSFKTIYLVILAVHSAEGPAPLWQNTGICQFLLSTEKERSATK